MSTLGQPHLEPAWKQEVSRRIAAHKNRKPGAAAPTQESRASNAASSRAAEAAARVAARYANARTYSEMQAEEARVAVRAAEIATKVALEAQAAAESALAEMHAASEQTMRGPAVIESIDRGARTEAVETEWVVTVVDEPAAEVTVAVEEIPEAVAPVVVSQPEAAPIITREVVDGRSYDIRWEPDLPVRVMESRAAAPRVEAPRVQEQFELAPEDWWTPAEVSATLHSEPLQVEAQAIHANLIEFPRELVATRKMRPRLAEATAEPEAQLSIFEVDPGTVSTEAEAEAVTTARSEEWTGSDYASPRYPGPEWSGIQLDAHPSTQQEVQPELVAEANRPDIAAFGLRLMATVVDCALIVGVFFAAASWLTAHMHQVPALKSAEAMGIAGLLMTGLAYYGVFFGIGKITPGMKYAGIALSTFDDEVPNRTQLRRRFGAMVLSLLPVGLGLLWSIFDEDHLSWHDRISGTYLRKAY